MKKTYSIVDMRKALKWFQHLMRIEDWDIDLYFQDYVPQWAIDAEDPETIAGYCEPFLRFKTAKIWVSPAKCFLFSYDVVGTLFHELTHVVFCDLGFNENERTEFVVDKFGMSLGKLYRYEKRKK